MTRHQYFRDSTADNTHEYDMHGFARFHARLFGGSGISNTTESPNPYDDFSYKVREGMECELGSGFAVYEGYMLEEDEPLVFTHDSADPDNDRIDLVVAQFNLNAEDAEFLPLIKKGSPALSPNAPELTQNKSRYEIPIAEVKIKADEASIKDSHIKDRRVGNYIPLNNLQRGVQVDEHGMVEMPNQSFIKTRGNDNFTVPAETSLGNAKPINLGETEEDKQNEVHSSTEIKVKGSGVYHFWVELGFNNNQLDKNSEIHVYLFVNGEQSFPLGTKLFADSRDNYMIVTGVDSLEQGDVIDFRVASYQFPNEKQVKLLRVRSAKLS